jgi:hypothetical protein
MNRKQFLILLALVAALGAAGILVYQHSRQSWNSGGAAIGDKLLPNLPVNDVARITIVSGTNALELAHTGNVWRVTQRAGYPANFSQISELLLKIADLKAVQSQDIGPSQRGRLGLLPPGAGSNTASLIEFKDQNMKTLGSLFLGKKHLHKPAANAPMGGMGDEGWPDGRYVMTSAGAASVAVISDPLDNVEPKPEQWLNKDFLSVEKPREIAVRFPEATNSWKLTRASETNDWQLADAKPGEKLDVSKISSVTAPFNGSGFNDVAAPSAADAAGKTLVTVDTFDGFSYVATIGPKLEDNYPVRFSVSANLPASRPPAKDEKPADKAKLDKDFQAQLKTLADKLAKESAFTNWVYQLSAYSLDEVLKPRQQLLEEAATNSAAKAEK